MLDENVVAIVTAYQVSKPDSLVVVIPKRVRKMLGTIKGERFIVKVDKDGRIIYEPLKERPKHE